ncbi:MAG: FtsX-like permease family protein, partial [Ruminiclostridium sp.]|nr:FtsX-like permease family protein [Ruminiclostridium sp.]
IKLFSEDFQILPFIFIVIASFSGAAVTARIMKEENVQMGVMYAFGYKRSTLYLHYMLYPLVIWAVGVTTGCTGGILMTPAIAGIQKTRYLFTDIITKLDPEALIKAAVIPLISLFVICSAGILTALMKRPLELIRGEKKQSRHPIISALSLNGFRFRPRFTIRLFLRNIFRELFLTFGIAISAVLLLTFVSMITSFGSVLSLSFDRILDYELMYTLKAPQTDDLGENCYINNISVLLDDDYVSFNGVRDDISAMNYDDADGNAADLSGLHAITVNMAAKYGIHEGDTVTLTNSMNGDKYDIRIDKICMSYVENFISIPLGEFNELMGQPEGSYIIIASRGELGIDEDRISTVATKEADRKAVSETILPLNILLSIIFIFASFTAFILIITVSSVIIEENHYTITLMKAFGYTDRLVSSLVIDINAAAAGIGYLIGIPLTLKLSDKVFAFMSDTHRNVHSRGSRSHHLRCRRIVYDADILCCQAYCAEKDICRFARGGSEGKRIVDIYPTVLYNSNCYYMQLFADFRE